MTKDTNNERDLLTTEQAADILAMSPKTLAKWRCTGETPDLKHIKIGGRVRYMMGDLTAYIDGLRLLAANDE